ncbi:MAG: translocation/assembly module TamB domain-containing protein [Paracoccus sp. (in: a-proteobacteria)]
MMLKRILLLLALIVMLPLTGPAPVLAQDKLSEERAELVELSRQEADDKGFLTRFLQSRLSTAGRTVTIDGFQGALSSRATFDRIAVSDDEGTWLVLHDGAIQWTRAALLRGGVEIGELTAALIEIPRGPHNPEKEAQQQTSAEAGSFNFELPELPVDLTIDKINAERVALGTPLVGEDAVLSVAGSLSLKGGEGEADLKINRIDGKKGDFTFTGSFSNSSRVLNIDLLLDEDPGGILTRFARIEGQPALSGYIRGNGPLKDFQAEVALATDGVERISGKLSMQSEENNFGMPGSRFILDVSGDIASLVPEQNRPFFGKVTEIEAGGWRSDAGRIEVDALAFSTDALKIRGKLATNDQGAPAMLDLSVEFGQQAGAPVLPVRIPFVSPPISVHSGHLTVGYDGSTGSDWKLNGWLSDIDRDSGAQKIGRLGLDGQGQVTLAEDGRLQQIDGLLGFDASGIELADPGLQQALGDHVTGSTSFDYTPDQVLELVGMHVTGKDYTLGGNLTFDGLVSGLVLSTSDLTVSQENLANLSMLAGRNLSGQINADLSGHYQLLTGAFDIDGVMTGTDLSVDDARLDHLLAGQSSISLSAGRTEDGTELRELMIHAQRIALTTNGTITNDQVDLSANFEMPTLADLDPSLDGALSAKARLSGAPGGRELVISGQALGLKTGVSALDRAFAGTSGLSAQLKENQAGGFELTDLRLANPQLVLTGTGVITGARAEAHFGLDIRDLAAMGENLAGVLRASVDLTTDDDGVRRIAMTGTGQEIGLGQKNLDGAFAGRTRFAVNAEQRGDELRITDARLNNDQLSATASAQLTATGSTGQARFEMDTLAPLGSGWSGSLVADAAMEQGEDGIRHFRVDAEGQDVVLGQKNADGALSGRTDIALIAEQQPAGGLVLQSLDITNPQLEATASGSLKDGVLDGQGAAKIADLSLLGLGWSGSLDATAALAGSGDGARQVTINGTGHDIRLGQAQPGAPKGGQAEISIQIEQGGDGAISIKEADITSDQLNIHATGQIGDDGTNATAQIEALDLTSLGLGLQGALNAEASFSDIGDGSRRLRVTGTGEDLALGQPARTDLRSGTTQIDISALERGGVYTIERAELNGEETRINAEGVVGANVTDARLTLDLGNLARWGAGMSGAIQGEASVKDDGAGARGFAASGIATDLALRGAGKDQALLGETRLSASGKQVGGLITLDGARIEHPDLNLTASGTYGAGQTDLDASVQAGDLGFLGGGIGGAMNAEAAIRDDAAGRHIEAKGLAKDLRLGNARADAALAGETRISLRAVQDGDQITVETLEAENPQLSLHGQGDLTGGSEPFRAGLTSPDLAFLGPGYGGQAEAALELSGSGGVRNFALTGGAKNLKTGNAQLNGVLASPLSFSASGAQTGGRIRLDAAEVKNARLNASASGVIGAGQTDLEAKLAAPDLGVLAPQLKGRANATARIEDRPEGRRITAEAIMAGLGIGNERVDGLLGGETRADLVALQGAGGLRIDRLDIRNPNIKLDVDGLLTEGLNVDASLADLQVLVPGIIGPAQAKGRVQQVESGLNMDIAVTAPGGTRGQLSGLLAAEKSDLRMSGVSDAAVANPILRTRSVEGPVSFDLRLQGKPGPDSLTGDVAMRGGHLADPKIGLTITDLNMDAQLNGGLIGVQVSGGLDAGGSVAVDGNIDLRGAQPVLDLTARLDNAVLRDPAIYQITTDGTLSISGIPSDGPLVSGRINILEADFRIPSTGLGGSKAIPDMIHVGDSWQAAATRAKAGLEPYGSAAAAAAGLRGPAAIPPKNPARFDLVISAPNKVFVRGRGVDAELGGEMKLTGNARQPIPVGHLTLIRGRVDLLGKRFDLSEGLIEMQGSVIPFLRLIALHFEESINIRIIIDGDLRDPDITFESDPALPEEEVMSYLLFGQGLDELSALQVAQLANALAILAGKGGVGIVGSIRNATGLDDLDMTIGDDGEIAVRAGKYLTRNVYTDVELDDEGRTQVNINLDLNAALTARGSTDSAGDSTLGLYYEKDY